MSVEVVEFLPADRPATVVVTQRVHFSQPLRRHLQKIRENLPQRSECPLMLLAAETNESQSGSAESMSIA